ncbi:uncharacterized protein BDR25DRAFT_359501 [Lindgomyces ingoldianus]|uniref:Uncharacterized protein n=1 Tax=Lindgomyces ingoldianus TaxID=673940 RepID=A0ACB6QKE4_9PLEO|nr:uncharacterized protein BDR25DRAFT_359501 [Lindgomyces ingoldianus]KAF2466610.1 hypothetical protein BDR25DRAFT_359501 [Lindgomyces ingoldianus]
MGSISRALSIPVNVASHVTQTLAGSDFTRGIFHLHLSFIHNVNFSKGEVDNHRCVLQRVLSYSLSRALTQDAAPQNNHRPCHNLVFLIFIPHKNYHLQPQTSNSFDDSLQPRLTNSIPTPRFKRLSFSLHSSTQQSPMAPSAFPPPTPPSPNPEIPLTHQPLLAFTHDETIATHSFCILSKFGFAEGLIGHITIQGADEEVKLLQMGVALSGYLAPPFNQGPILYICKKAIYATRTTRSDVFCASGKLFPLTQDTCPSKADSRCMSRHQKAALLGKYGLLTVALSNKALVVWFGLVCGIAVFALGKWRREERGERWGGDSVGTALKENVEKGICCMKDLEYVIF